MRVSDRIARLAGSDDSWDVYFRAAAMRAAGEDVAMLTIGEHDIPTDPAILGAMDGAARAGHTGYAEIPGVTALREAVAARVSAQSGVATELANVLITPGGQAGLFAAHMALLDPGDRALMIDPYYATYPGTIMAAGGEPVPVRARPEHGFQPGAEDIAAACDARTRSLLINSPNNPTGVVYGRATLEGIADVCRERDLWLISDEVYDTQIWEGEHLSARALPGMAERTLVVGSMSKSHAMTGSRVGWVVGPEEVIAHMINLAINTTYGVPGFIQDAALFALAQGSALEEEIAAPFRRRRALARELLAGQNALRPVPSGGAMYLMLDIRASGLSGVAFANRLLDEQRIAVMPGESFGAAASGHVRVAMTIDDDAFADALRRLIAFTKGLAP